MLFAICEEHGEHLSSSDLRFSVRFPDRLMAGHLVLVQAIMVRIPVREPKQNTRCKASVLLCVEFSKKQKNRTPRVKRTRCGSFGMRRATLCA